MTDLLRKVGNFLSYHFNGVNGQFTHAVMHNDIAKVDRLLDRYGSELVNKIGFASTSSALMLATMHCHGEMVDRLIAHGALVNYCNHNGKTVLMEAAWMQQDGIYKKLVEHGADQNAFDKNGRGVKWYAESGKAWLNAPRSSSSSDEDYMTSSAHISHPLNIFNPLR